MLKSLPVVFVVITTLMIVLSLSILQSAPIFSQKKHLTEPNSDVTLNTLSTDRNYGINGYDTYNNDTYGISEYLFKFQLVG